MPEGTIRLKDGRLLGYAEYGDRKGKPVFFFHGTPGSRKMRHPDDYIAEEAHVRFITIDRPGYGDSDFLPGRTFLDWPRDVSQLADHLGVDRFQVVAFSGGGPYALATGLHLKERVKSIALLSSVGPLDTCRSNHRNGLVQLIFRLGRWAPWLLRGGVKIAVAKGARDFDGAFEWAAARLPECDRQVILQPEVRSVFQESLTESFRNGNAAFLREVELLTKPWKLPLHEVLQPIALWHGEMDAFANGHALADLLPNCLPTFLPEGHLLFFSHWPEIIQQLRSF